VASKRLKNQDNSTVAILGYQLDPATTPKKRQERKVNPLIPYLWLGGAMLLSVSLLLGSIWLGNKANRDMKAAHPATVSR
jgi:hypothetical protein